MKKITLLLLALSFSICALAQITIKGTVVNDYIPLESASIIIKNSTKGIATNIKGQFKLEAKKGDTLSISYLGYETKELVVNQDEIFRIRLEEGGKLEEVVVLAYGSITKCYYKSCCCWITIEEEESLTLNKEELLKHRLFPNPSSNGIFQLNLNEVYDEIDVLITNISGQAIQNTSHKKFGEKLTIDLSEAAVGIYIINVIADGCRLETFKAIRS